MFFERVLLHHEKAEPPAPSEGNVALHPPTRRGGQGAMEGILRRRSYPEITFGIRRRDRRIRTICSYNPDN